MPLDPSVYAGMLAEKVAKSGANVYLVNTGWCGNSGKRMNLKYTRAMVTAALNGELEKAEFVTDPYFGVQVPTSCPGVPDEQMIPRQAVGGRHRRLRGQGQGAGQVLCGELQEVHPYACRCGGSRPQGRVKLAGTSMGRRICGAPFL